MEKPDHIVRLEAEHATLKERIDKLQTFVIGGDAYTSLCGMDQDLLLAQLSAMQSYARLLTMRLGRAMERECDRSIGMMRTNPPSPQVSSAGDNRVINNTMRHAYRVLTDAEKAAMQKIKDDGLAMVEFFDSLGGSREISLAKTKVEEAVMWAVKHLTA